MRNEIKEFKQLFNNIRALGYVKSINNSNSGIGLTFERLIGKEEDNFPLPDYKNTIEIKTKLAFSKKPIHLFKLSPEGKNFFETKYLLDKYGYFYKGSKTLNTTLYCNTKTQVGKNYYFSIKINYKEEKIELLIYNNRKEFIEQNAYWSFNKIENSLVRKLKYLAFIQVWSTTKNNIKYYKYYKYNLYEYSNFYTFLNLIEKGIISITLSIDVYKTEKRLGKIHDHGSTFDIKKEDLNLLFWEIN